MIVREWGVGRRERKAAFIRANTGRGRARRGKTDSAQIVGGFPILIFSLGQGRLAGRMCLQLYLAGGGGGGDEREDEPKLLE